MQTHAFLWFIFEILYAHHQITRVECVPVCVSAWFCICFSSHIHTNASKHTFVRVKGSLPMINRTLSGRKRIVNRLRSHTNTTQLLSLILLAPSRSLSLLRCCGALFLFAFLRLNLADNVCGAIEELNANKSSDGDDFSTFLPQIWMVGGRVKKAKRHLSKRVRVRERERERTKND